MSMIDVDALTVAKLRHWFDDPTSIVRLRRMLFDEGFHDVFSMAVEALLCLAAIVYDRSAHPTPLRRKIEHVAQKRHRRSLVLSAPIRIDQVKFYDLYSHAKPPFGRLVATRKQGLFDLLSRIEADPDMLNVGWIAYVLATTLHECRARASKWQITWVPVSETGGAEMWYGAEEDVVDWDHQAVDSAGNPLMPQPPGTPGAAQPEWTASDRRRHKGKQSYLASATVKRQYYGRGFVQITFQDNYRAMDDALGLQKKLLLSPERALDPDLAYRIMSYGMRMGSFTGHRQRTDTQGYFGGHKLADYIGSAADYYHARAIINSDLPTNGQMIAKYARRFEDFLQLSRVN